MLHAPGGNRRREMEAHYKRDEREERQRERREKGRRRCGDVV
jgi:hypothetical protein